MAYQPNRAMNFCLSAAEQIHEIPNLSFQSYTCSNNLPMWVTIHDRRNTVIKKKKKKLLRDFLFYKQHDENQWR